MLVLGLRGLKSDVTNLVHMSSTCDQPTYTQIKNKRVSELNTHSRSFS